MSTMASTRNAACPCGSGRRFKHCHGRMSQGMDANLAGGRLDFVVAGAQRSGTTSLDLHLRNHPAIAMPRTRKELHFFDDDARFASGEVDYDDYHAHFAPRRAGQLRGEVTPSYVYWIPAVERLARYNPLLRIVVILRNPITRAYSHWNKESQRGRESLPFLDALRAERERAAATPSGQDRRTSYADRGFYAGQLRRLWTHFPRDQTLILRSEALRSECMRTLGCIAEFLGVGAFPAIAPMAANVRHYERPMRADEWDWLAGQFAAEIREIESLLGWDCRDWLRRPLSDPENAVPGP